MADTLYLGADHAGFELKEKLKAYLKKKGVTVRDLGAWKLDKHDDYPDYAFPVAKLVVQTGSKGILVCGSAEGICIAANKVKGARAVPIWSVKNARVSRQHNDANILCIAGGKTVAKTHGLGLSFSQAKKIVDAWISEPFLGAARHVRRLHKISRFEHHG
ncbi:RpiB/LacA/LacB family sugar-phosphate isomerase [Candidatus Woesearchaeota archaeon]|nr:RpiB/LacA/LacB family sugar-phosphate isomerase [Candidatus Woesearchaeota archaeon]